MQQRKTYLDILRIFAIFFVIYTHVGYNCDTIFSSLSTPITYAFSSFLGIFCRVAVPLFFMISGGLLLKKNETIGKLFKNRILRFGIVLVLFSAIIYMVQWNNHSIMGFVGTLYGDKVVPSYWYLYSYIELLLLLPLLRKLAQNMKKQDFLYYFILQFVFTSILPVVETAIGLSSINIQLVLLTKNIFYFMMGHFFINVAKDKFYSKRNLMLINLAGLVCVIAGCLYITIFYTENGSVTDANIDVPLFAFTSVPTFAIFFDCRYFFGNKTFKNRTSKILEEIGSATFGVYLLHSILIKYTTVISDALVAWLPPCVSGLVYSLFVMVVCTAVIIPLRKLPLLKKLI